MPEPSSQVDRAKNGTARAPDFADAFAYIFHGVFIGVRLVVQGTKVLYQPYPSILFHHCEYGAVVATAGGLDYAEF